MIIFFALNVCLMIVTARTDKASDKEWFRIRFINTLAIVFQAILGVVNFIRMLDQLNQEDDERCHKSWIIISIIL